MLRAIFETVEVALNPLNTLCLLFVLVLILVILRKRKSSALISCLFVVYAGVLLWVPAGDWLVAKLENEFEIPTDLSAVDGIVVLGGAIDLNITADRDQVHLLASADRMTQTVKLARQYPQAKVLFTGGVASAYDKNVTESTTAEQFFIEMGLELDRLLLEDRSHNTRENAQFGYQVAQPQAGEQWLLVTSALHMKRSVAVFEEAGWDVIPYPVDYRAPSTIKGWSSPSNSLNNAGRFVVALHEWGGLLYYQLSR